MRYCVGAPAEGANVPKGGGALAPFAPTNVTPISHLGTLAPLALSHTHLQLMYACMQLICLHASNSVGNVFGNLILFCSNTIFPKRIVKQCLIGSILQKKLTAFLPCVSTSKQVAVASDVLTTFSLC